MNGVFAIKKPRGPTSQDVVAKLKRIFTASPEFAAEGGSKNGVKGARRNRKQKFIKIGHGGTLDPLAEGVLVIGVGTGTKQLHSYLGQCAKVYSASAVLGASTTTYDSEGPVLEYGELNPSSLTDAQVRETLQGFRGKIMQLPPVFSALKMDGKPLYEYAREGKTLPRPIEPRECEVERLDSGTLRFRVPLPQKIATDAERAFAESVTQRKLPEIPTHPPTEGAALDLTFSVSAGTYIRSLIHDIGASLGTAGYMEHLIRESQGDWELGKNALPLNLFDEDHDKWWPVLERILKEGPRLHVDEEIIDSANESSSPHEETQS